MNGMGVEQLAANLALGALLAGLFAIVALGSLGEANTLTGEEKVAIVRSLREELQGRAPVVAGIASLSTAESVQLARAAADAGADGLMVLPPYVYRGDWRETEAYFSAVIRATPLSCMLYNNPIAYGTDVTAEKAIVRFPDQNPNPVLRIDWDPATDSFLFEFVEEVVAKARTLSARLSVQRMSWRVGRSIE